MPRAVSVVEVQALLGVLLAEPQRFGLRDLHGGEPGVSGRVVGELEDDVDFFEGAESGFGVEEVDEGQDGEVCGGEDDPGAVGNALECYGGYEDDTVLMLVFVYYMKGCELMGDIHKVE
jgi:hypothetical protein